ncbi:hypothetical protein [Streptomyces sp. NPDC002540]
MREVVGLGPLPLFQVILREPLQNFAAEGLQEQYFKDRCCRAAGFQVKLTDIDYTELDF